MLRLSKSRTTRDADTILRRYRLTTIDPQAQIADLRDCTADSEVAEIARRRTVLSSAASCAPKAFSNSCCASRHFSVAALSRAAPVAVRRRLRVRPSSPAPIASNSSRSDGG
jgi:hypothetical protein